MASGETVFSALMGPDEDSSLLRASVSSSTYLRGENGSQQTSIKKKDDYCGILYSPENKQAVAIHVNTDGPQRLFLTQRDKQTHSV